MAATVDETTNSDLYFPSFLPSVPTQIDSYWPEAWKFQSRMLGQDKSLPALDGQTQATSMRRVTSWNYPLCRKKVG